MDAQRTRKVINRIIAENYPIEPRRPTPKPRRQLKSFRQVTGGSSRKTNVLISPKMHDAENNVNVNELSRQALRGYVKKASKDISQRKDDYVKDIQDVREPKFKDVFRKIGNRAVGIQKASRRMTMPKEEAPTNSMSLSSSTHGTGNIDTYDPLPGKKRKRKPTARRNP